MSGTQKGLSSTKHCIKQACKLQVKQSSGDTCALLLGLPFTPMMGLSTPFVPFDPSCATSACSNGCWESDRAS